MLVRVLELQEQVKMFLSVTNKVDMLSAFNKKGFDVPLAYLADIYEGFEAQLAYLADIYEALNKFNKKLQG